MAALISGCALPHRSADGSGTLCEALDEFAGEALRTSDIQESILIKEQPMQIVCTAGENDPAQTDYCHAILTNVSMEFAHDYPWQIRSCVESDGGKVKITTVPEYTGLVGWDKIVLLEGTLRIGVKVEMTFTPSCKTDAQMEPGGGCYWGRYHLTLTPPD
jgi:hypothetical protein